MRWFRRREELDTEKLQELCRLAGYLLAHQAGITAELGEIAIPRALVTTEEKPDNVQMLVFTNDTHDNAVAKGRLLLKDGEGQYRCWILAYDVNLRSPETGEKVNDAFVVEAGFKGLERPLSFLQCYATPGEDRGFRLIGNVEAMRQEEWPPAVRTSMDAIDWRDFVLDGARVHPLVGELWDQWRDVG